MPEEALILKRNPDAEYSESYNVLFEGRYVDRTYKAVSHAPREAWGAAVGGGISCASRDWRLKTNLWQH